MTLLTETHRGKSRLAPLLDHVARIEDPRDLRRILYPLPEVLLLVDFGTIADCDDYEDIAANAVREHWAIEILLDRVLDLTFGGDRSRLRKSHGGA